MLKAAAAKVAITPESPSFLLGYPHVPRISTGTHDELTAQMLYLENGSSRLLLISLDLLMLDRENALYLRRVLADATNLPEQGIFVGCTHTHSGPVTVKNISFEADPLTPPTDMAYFHRICQRMAKCAATLPDSAVAAELAWGSTLIENFGGNRIAVDGPCDPEAGILAVRSASDGKLISVMMNYSVHPTVMHEDSKLFSADYPFYARKELLEHFNPDMAIPFLLGCAGNQSPRYYVRAQTFAEAERLGRILGSGVAKKLDEMLGEPGLWQSDPVLAGAITEVEMVKRDFPPVSVAEARLKDAVETFERLKRENAGHGKIRTAECAVFGAEESVYMSRCGETGELQAVQESKRIADQHTLRIGDAFLVGLPGEIFVEYALKIKRKAARKCFVASLVNGELQGYIVTQKDAEAGGYEAWNACFGPESGDRLVKAALAKVAEL